jgi:hypothetical protein
MKLLKWTAVLAVLALSLTACSGDKGKSAASGEVKASVGDTKDTGGDEKKPEAKMDCPAKSVITKWESTNTAQPEGFSYGEAKAAGVRKASKRIPVTENKTVWVYVANFELPTDFNIYKTPLEPAQAFVKLELARKEGEKLTVGKYKVNPEFAADFRATPSVKFTGGKTALFKSHGTEGEVEVTGISETKICGKFNFKDHNSEVVGEFVAEAK